jgi:hypothetical protein
VKEQRAKRVRDRKFKRIFVRFGLEAPQFTAAAIQISTEGLFISTTHPVYLPGTKLSIEIPTPNGSYKVMAIVRHAKKLPRGQLQHERSGMGVEFINLPQELRDYLASL